MKKILLFVAWFLASSVTYGRARDLGIVIGAHSPGKYNSITDVRGIRVGHVTLNKRDGALVPGKGPIRTGVTVILPEGDIWNKKVAAGSSVLNGNGEAMGLMWIQESGILETPIALTNTLNVSNVQKGLLQWMIQNNPKIGVSDDTLTPVVLECDDSSLNDILGQHVTPEHVLEAIMNAGTKEVAEGSVGAGTGMISYEFKGGIGTSSRVLSSEEGGYTVGVLLNANHGRRKNLRVLGNPVGEKVKDLIPKMKQEGSVVVIIATDAPLDSRQLSRLAKRAFLGVGRTGATAYHGSGDVAIAFSTANRIPHYPKDRTYNMKVLSDFHINPLFEAVADASEEAILNALFAAKTMTGRDGNTVYALPQDRIQKWVP